MALFGLFGGNNNQPKEIIEATEDDALVEINRLYDSEKSFRHSGDKTAALIQEHHKREAIHEYMEKNTGDVITWDSKADRYTRWNGKWR